MSIRVRIEHRLDRDRFAAEIETDNSACADTIAMVVRAANEALGVSPQPTFTDQPTEYPAPTSRQKKRARPR
jgi:hypothetical protein